MPVNLNRKEMEVEKGMKVSKDLKEYILDELEARLKELRKEKAREYNQKYGKELSKMRKLLKEYRKIKDTLEKVARNIPEIYFSEIDAEFLPNSYICNKIIARKAREYIVTLQYAENPNAIKDILKKIRSIKSLDEFTEI